MTPSPYFLPAEWLPQSAILLTWPHRYSDWAPMLDQVEPVFVEIAKNISYFQSVIINCHDSDHIFHVRRLLNEAKADLNYVTTFPVLSNDTWARDHGPITRQCRQDNRLELLDFTFNGWGGKFQADLDDAITQQLYYRHAAFGTNLQYQRIPFVLEGGAIESDGEGRLLMTKRSVLSDTRNPGWDQARTEELFRNLLGMRQALWLEHGGLAGDDTDGHIDTLARFYAPGGILYLDCPDPQDEHYQDLQAMKEELQSFLTSEGKPYHLVALPWPMPHYREGKRVAATYANFLIINGAVLIPFYQDAHSNSKAIEVIGSCFPDRQMIGVACSPIIEQGGSLHCLTMQIPRLR